MRMLWWRILVPVTMATFPSNRPMVCRNGARKRVVGCGSWRGLEDEIQGTNSVDAVIKNDLLVGDIKCKVCFNMMSWSI